MKTLTAWIENNPSTGEIKPWEVWLLVEDFAARRIASCKTEAAARKSMASSLKRNAPYFKII